MPIWGGGMFGVCLWYIPDQMGISIAQSLAGAWFFIMRMSRLACGEERSRRYLHERSQQRWADEDLSNEEINWIMEVENYETTLMWWSGSWKAPQPLAGHGGSDRAIA